MLDKVEDALKLNKERILSSLKAIETEEKYNNTEIWEMIEVQACII